MNRQQFVEAQKALKSNKIVLADRWNECYLAYHTQFGELAEDIELRNRLNDAAFQGVVPDLTIMLDLEVEMAEARMLRRGMGHFDSKGRSFHKKMRAALLQQAKEDPNHWIVVEGNREKDKKTIHDEILKIILPRLKNENKTNNCC